MQDLVIVKGLVKLFRIISICILAAGMPTVKFLNRLEGIIRTLGAARQHVLVARKVVQSSNPSLVNKLVIHTNRQLIVSDEVIKGLFITEAV